MRSTNERGFYVTHNHRETKYWKVDDTRRMPNYDEIANIPHADATDKDINELLARLKVFKEDIGASIAWAECERRRNISDLPSRRFMQWHEWWHTVNAPQRVLERKHTVDIAQRYEIGSHF